MNVFDTTKLPSPGPVRAICAGDGVLGIQYAGYKLAVLSTTNATLNLIASCAESRWMFPRCAVLSSNKMLYVRVMGSGDPQGQLSIFDTISKSLTQLPCITPTVTKFDFQAPNKMVLMDTTNTLYWGEPFHMDTPTRTLQLNTTLVKCPLRDLTIDEYGLTYLLDNSGNLFSVAGNDEIKQIPIPPWLVVGSIEGI